MNKIFQIGPLLWGALFGLAALLGSLALSWGGWTVLAVVVAFFYGNLAWNYETRQRLLFGPLTQLLVAAVALIYYFLVSGWQNSFSGIAFVVLAAVVAIINLLEFFSSDPSPSPAYPRG